MAQIIPRGKSTYLVRVFKGRDAAGRRSFVNQTVKGTKTQAKAVAAQLEVTRATGRLVQPTRDTVETFLTGWLAGTAKLRLRPQTLRSYEKQIRLYVIPAIGFRRVRDLEVSEVDQLYASLLERGLSARTVQYVHAILRAAFRHALKTAKLTTNPTAFATVPKRTGVEMKFLTGAESEAFLRAAAGDDWFALWVVLITTGMRPSEALGLKWSDVAPGQITINRSMVVEKGVWRFDDCKTKKARRTVSIPPLTDEALRAHRVRQVEKRLALGRSYQDSDIVFAGNTGGPPSLRSLTRHHFNKILEAAGLDKVRVYDLRHTHVSALLADGVPVMVVSGRVGHASAKMTLDVYGHVSPQQHVGVVDKVARLFAAGL